ncbi:MAG: serine/threonine protein kinase [Sandaracinaceae bacterium]|nr:serine/threonine protein kinase [Sandaracinaceae bacterium]
MHGDQPGTVLANKYELIEKAGSGGMAVVWRARTLGAAGFSRPVAVKRIIRHLSMDPSFVAMFVEEARVVSELQHPGVTQIHDFGLDEVGHYFLVMEWVEGCDLARLAESFAVDGSVVPWSIVAAIGIEVLGALGAAHRRVTPEGAHAPIIHRDVTPQNILLSTDGFVKLTDFGIARAMDRDTMTRPNALKGKISYVAPERLKSSDCSVASDLFGVGVCLWEALAGRPLYDAPTDMQVMFMVADAIIPDIRELRPDVPDGLHEILTIALSKDPRDRYGSAHLMSRKLAELLRKSDEATDSRRIAEIVRGARGRLAIGEASYGPGGTTEVLEGIEEMLEP